MSQTAALARVSRAELVVRGRTPGDVSSVARKALVVALEEVAAQWPSEWIFVRRVSIDLRARSGPMAVGVDDLAAAIARVLQRELAIMRAEQGDARDNNGMSAINEDVAWFSDEGRARGTLLGRLLAGAPLRWPYTAMPWAKSLGDTASWRGGDLGDALAYAVGRVGEAPTIPEGIAAVWLHRWTTQRASTLDPSSLPQHVLDRTRAAADSRDGPAAARIRALAHLFAAWPPARDSRIDASAADRLARRQPHRAQPAEWSSRAGGLLAWALLFERTGLGDALWERLPDERCARAARWTLARALEAPETSDNDPIVRLWAGEAPGGAPMAHWILDSIDPEPVHGAAVRFSAARGWLDGGLVLVPFGDQLVAVANEDLCLDAEPRGNTDALPAIVKRYADRVGRPPSAVTVQEQLPASMIDAVADVDIMRLPERWRVATRAGASVARRLAAEVWRTDLRALRAWPARVHDVAPVRIELDPTRAARVRVALEGKASIHGAPVVVTTKPLRRS